MYSRLIYLILFLLISNIKAMAYTNTNSWVYKVRFDYKDHPREREIAYNHYLKEYQDILDDTITLEKGNIGIDLYDINNDGKKEIIAYINHSSFCGSAGCRFDIFKVHTTTSQYLPIRWSTPQNSTITTLVVPEDIYILDHITLGYHDIMFGSTTWKWQGNYYNTFNKPKN